MLHFFLFVLTVAGDLKNDAKRIWNDKVSKTAFYLTVKIDWVIPMKDWAPVNSSTVFSM